MKVTLVVLFSEAPFARYCWCVSTACLLVARGNASLPRVSPALRVLPVHNVFSDCSCEGKLGLQRDLGMSGIVPYSKYNRKIFLFLISSGAGNFEVTQAFLCVC